MLVGQYTTTMKLTCKFPTVKNVSLIVLKHYLLKFNCRLLSLFRYAQLHHIAPIAEVGVANVSLFTCLLYTSDAADDLTRVDLGGRRITTFTI